MEHLHSAIFMIYGYERCETGKFVMKLELSIILAEGDVKCGK